jgi:hypothetical protein
MQHFQYIRVILGDEIRLNAVQRSRGEVERRHSHSGSRNSG